MDIFNDTEKKITPIEILTNALAEITTRAMNAEREAKEMQSLSNTWYQEYLKFKAENETLQNQLEGLKENNAGLQTELSDAEEICANLREQLHKERIAHEQTKGKLDKAINHLNYHINGTPRDTANEQKEGADNE